MTVSPTLSSSVFGKTAAGEEVHLFVLTNNSGMQVKITNYGGIITSLCVPDARGNFADVVLGFDALEPYLQTHLYLGAVVGRLANRLAYGRFQLNGKNYQLALNDGAHHLHGGFTGFDRALWSAQTVTKDDAVQLNLTHWSPDGDQGYPGNLQVSVSYTLTNDNALEIKYRAITDQPTPVNLTQHSYFNLSGQQDILQHQLMINASGFLPVDAQQIPLGNISSVIDTPFDFRVPENIGTRNIGTRNIGTRIDGEDGQLRIAGGYDHCFVLDKQPEKRLSLAAQVNEPVSGRVLEMYTEEPGMQFYSGNFLDGSLMGKGRKLTSRSGFCLEPQHFPDAPNHAGFPSVILYPGDEYSSRTILKFSTRV